MRRIRGGRRERVYAAQGAWMHLRGKSCYLRIDRGSTPKRSAPPRPTAPPHGQDFFIFCLRTYICKLLFPYECRRMLMSYLDKRPKDRKELPRISDA
ncbi:MAG: hypothetical protein NT154_06970, partial [Verrucomicrobia bacterium]|nr:hypothetical protein [Verrucomicrobiota bacterium]